MALDIPFPGPNSQGVVVIRVMIVAGVGYGKTTAIKCLAPEFAPPEKWRACSPAPGTTGRTVIGERLGIQGTVLYGADREACQRYFSELLKGGTALQIIDEFDEYCPGGNTGASGGYCCEALYRVVNYARNEPYEIGLIVSARGTSDVTTNAIRAMDVVLFGQIWEGNAIKYLRSSVRQGDIDFEAIVRNLPKFWFMVWCPQAGGFKGFIEVHPDGTWREVTPDDLPEAGATDETDSSTNPSENPPSTPTSTPTGESPASDAE